MSFSKKKSRLITVDGIDFRYTISRSSSDKNWNFNLSVTIQIAHGKGSILRVTGLITRDHWLDFPNPSKADNDYPVIMPRHIENFIRLGIHNGWNPEVSGQPHTLKLENKEVFK